MDKGKVFFSIAVFLILFMALYAYAYDTPRWFPFNAENALDEWKEKIFKGRVVYAIEVEPKDGYLMAKSDQTSSGLLYKVKFDVIKNPMMSWQWKVKTFPKKEMDTEDSAGWIERDDYAARVYVIFPSWNFLNVKSLEYIWDENLPEDTILTSPYFKNIKLVVVESGKNGVDQWIFEERNIYEDYKKAFGRTPPHYVGAIAIMTDADNSLSKAEAFYKNLRVGYQHE